MKRRRGRISADEGLAVENFDELNRAFYAAEPDQYFKHRLGSLLLVAGAPEDVEQLLSRGVEFGRLRFGEADDETATVRDERRRNFVTAEAETLLHHAGESLLRIYKAHETRRSPCPWLEISKEKGFATFKAYLARRFGPATPPVEARGRVARVFYGATDPTALRPEPTEDEWNTELDAVEDLLREFAGHLLRRSAPYNAAKHGLAMTVGNAEFSLTPNTPDPALRSILGAQGPSITCLEERTAEGRSRWCKATYWVDLDATLALIFIATSLIAAAWDVGRAKYLGPPADGLRLRRFGHVDLSRIRENGVIADKVAMDLLYYRD